MTVYVDDMNASFRGMKMCHMIADTEAELHAMANKIGLQRRWYQGDHYDVSHSLKLKALSNGAIAITMRQLGCMHHLRKRNPNAPLCSPDDVIEKFQKRHATQTP